MAVFLEVRHRIKPITNTAFDLFVDFYSDTVVPAMDRHGIDLIGGWKVTGGEMGWDLSIHRYESMAHAEECLNSLGQDKALWSAVDKLRGEIEIEEITKFANTVSYGTEERLQAALDANPDQPRQYMLAVLQTATGGLLPAIKTIGSLVDTLEGAGAMQLATAYASRVGRTGELTDLWIMPHGPSGMMEYRPGDALKDIVGPLREHAPDEDIYFLNPLPYSKLQ
ncbi:MAG: NIPSNAP family protein [Chloroflexi bacterium]|nr:NIPSNAP family protein [Chloroflexota bacterium]MCY3589013.1 NIPSNAP family protein [Chloroflexota bacterium]MCY3684773.1 NIPSNAP family protein [Chloroflexota bacterium]MDE2709790.1 NIPSNAP family protein [Chloroflexota bacterium]